MGFTARSNFREESLNFKQHELKYLLYTKFNWKYNIGAHIQIIPIFLLSL